MRLIVSFHCVPLFNWRVTYIVPSVARATEKNEEGKSRNYVFRIGDPDFIFLACHGGREGGREREREEREREAFYYSQTTIGKKNNDESVIAIPIECTYECILPTQRLTQVLPILSDSASSEFARQ